MHCSILIQNHHIFMRIATSINSGGYLNVHRQVHHGCYAHLCTSGPVQPSTAQYSPVRPSTAQDSPVQSSTAQYSPVQSSTVQYSPVQPSTVQYSPVRPSNVSKNWPRRTQKYCSCLLHTNKFFFLFWRCFFAKLHSAVIGVFYDFIMDTDRTCSRFK